MWGIDFQFDRVEDGQALKACSVDDEHTRESLGGLTGTSVTGERVIALTDLIAAVRGYPLVLRSDSGPESVCDAIADRAKGRIALAFIPPGTPWNNGYVESFHARQRGECLDINSFYSVLHAKAIIADWNHEYNHVRRHSSLNYKTPIEHAQTCTHRRQPATLTSPGPETGGGPTLQQQSQLLEQLHEEPNHVPYRKIESNT